MALTQRIFGVAALVATLLTATPAASGPATTTAATLPADSCAGPSAVWDGARAYVFGGSCRAHVQVFDPAEGRLTPASARFPTAIMGTSAVWTGEAAYVFGGARLDTGGGPCDCSDEIFRYDPEADTLTKMGARLPKGVQGTAAIWDGRYAYVFGGRYFDGGWRETSTIVRYDPAADEVSVSSARLATGATVHSAVWTGRQAYVFVNSMATHVLRFDPVTDSIAPMTGRFPTPRSDTAALFDGRHAYVVGPNEEIHRYDPATDTMVLVGTLPTSRSQPSAVWTGSSAFVIGGGGGSRKVVRFAPGGPSLPRTLTAVVGPEVGTIHLRWQAPAEADGGIAGYRIYRERTSTTAYGTSGSYDLLAEIGPQASYDDVRLPWSSRYVYRVTAVSSAGTEGGLSFAASAVTPSEPPSPIGLRRWSGAEAGSPELMCMTSDEHSRGCITLRGAGVTAAWNDIPFADALGAERQWPARTGRRFFAATPPPAGGTAYLNGWDAGIDDLGYPNDDPFTGGTVAFALRFDAPPMQPVVIFRHDDPAAQKVLEVSLMPDRTVLVRPAVGEAAVSKARLEPNAWNTLAMSYAPARPVLKLTLNGDDALATALSGGAPGGDINVGVVSSASPSFALGIDDYVEATAVDASIEGARIGSLLPQGNAGPNQWEKTFSRNNPYEPMSLCTGHMENWQMVSADVEETFFYAKSGNTHRCWEHGGTTGFVHTRTRGAIDRYGTEGIPSAHTPVSPTFRASSLPGTGDAVLAVRLRAEAGPGRAQVGLVDGGVVVEERIWGSSQLSLWGAQHPWRPSDGRAWDARSLSDLQLQLRSDPLEGEVEEVYSVQLDLVWVPA